MLEEQEKKFAKVQIESRCVLGGDRASAHLAPTWQNIDELDLIFIVLKPLRDFFDLLAGENRVTVSAVIPLLFYIKKKVLGYNKGDTDLTSEI